MHACVRAGVRVRACMSVRVDAGVRVYVLVCVHASLHACNSLKIEIFKFFGKCVVRYLSLSSIKSLTNWSYSIKMTKFSKFRVYFLLE